MAFVRTKMISFIVYIYLLNLYYYRLQLIYMIACVSYIFYINLWEIGLETTTRKGEGHLAAEEKVEKVSELIFAFVFGEVVGRGDCYWGKK